MRMVATVAGMLMLAGCEVPIPEQKNEAVIEPSGVMNAENAADVSANASAPADAAVDPAAGAQANRIPAAYRGRWGLVPADCTSTRGDNKGLMTVEYDRLRFYESRATPTKVETVSPTELRLSLSFEGEGQTWTEETPFSLSDNGNALTRISSEGQTLRYARCGA